MKNIVIYEGREFIKYYSKNKEEIEYCNKISDIYLTKIYTTDKRVYEDILNFQNLSKNISIEYVNKSYLKNFLIDISTKHNWIIYISNNKTNMIFDNLINIPYKFFSDIFEFDNESFTEHAKNKLIYNELSKYYMMSIANDTNKEVSLLQKIYEKYLNKKEGKILDCCCGVGRHDYILANAGYRVTGIDISENQIQTARKIHNHTNINYYIEDVRNFKLKDKNYDMAICMWTTYNYLSKEQDLKKFIFNVWNHLNNGGVLVLDSKNIPILDKKRVYSRKSCKESLEIDLLIFKRVVNNIQNSKYFYFINDKTKKHFYSDEEFVRFYYLDEIKSIVNGYFDIVDVYGNFDGEKYDPNKSERFIVVLRKRGNNR